VVFTKTATAQFGAIWGYPLSQYDPQPDSVTAMTDAQGVATVLVQAVPNGPAYCREGAITIVATADGVTSKPVAGAFYDARPWSFSPELSTPQPVPVGTQAVLYFFGPIYPAGSFDFKWIAPPGPITFFGGFQCGGSSGCSHSTLRISVTVPGVYRFRMTTVNIIGQRFVRYGSFTFQ
jgi:hypothetical protein